jgi:glucans biosynthesis protein
MRANPMHPNSVRKGNRDSSRLKKAPRCLARTRKGNSCQSPAVAGKKRCRMHGGAAGSGAPSGKCNGAYRHGRMTRPAIEERRSYTTWLRSLRATAKGSQC